MGLIKPLVPLSHFPWIVVEKNNVDEGEPSTQTLFFNQEQARAVGILQLNFMGE